VICPTVIIQRAKTFQNEAPLAGRLGCGRREIRKGSSALLIRLSSLGGGEISLTACLGAIMSLEHIFYVSQSIAAVAVIASLLYLAQQVRQAERVQRATMQQGRADRTSQAALAVASSELVRVLQKGMAGDTELTRFGSDFRSFGSAMLAQTKATSQNADAYAAWRNLLAAELGTAE